MSVSDATGMLILKLEAIARQYVPVAVVFEKFSLFEQTNHETSMILGLRHCVREYNNNVQSSGDSSVLDSIQNALPLIALNKMEASMTDDKIETPRECVCAHIANR